MRNVGCQNESIELEPVMEASLKEEALLDSLDHDNSNTNVPANDDDDDDVMSPMHKDYDEWMRRKLAEEGGLEEGDGVPRDIPALGPSDLEEVPLGPKGSRLKLDVDETKAKAGYQDLKNAGKFWRAACLLGTRKELISCPLIILVLFISDSVKLASEKPERARERHSHKVGLGFVARCFKKHNTFGRKNMDSGL